MQSYLRKLRAPLAVLALGFTILTACGGLPGAAGILGAIGSGFLLVLALVGLLSTQSGCDFSSEPCLSFLPQDSGIMPDASEMDAGDDAGSPDRVGPCLSQLPPDAGEDARVSPCLSDIGGPWDQGVEEDAGPEPGEDGGPTDAGMEMGRLDLPKTEYQARSDTIERLRRRGVLPPDVASALVGDTDGEEV